MNISDPLQLFISYSHDDEDNYIKYFEKHITPLRDNGLIEDWHDRKILPGKDYQDKIDNKLEDADIICLFISPNFLASSACKEEIKNSLELQRKRGIVVLPIILSSCGWKDYKDISSLLALPKDGIPIENWNSKNEAWLNVYEGLKTVIEQENMMKQLKITDEFYDFLQNAGLLTKVHPSKEKVLLDDIFVYPELTKYDELKEVEKDMNAEEIIINFNYIKMIIAGENQSGKTSLCKKIFQILRNKYLVPIFIYDENKKLQGKLDNIICKSFEKQYKKNSIKFKDIPKKRIVPIIDDFHFVKNKEKHIKSLAKYHHTILVVDDIFALNINDTNLTKSFTYFKIKEYKPTLRNKLIKRWLELGEEQSNEDNYQGIDKNTELVDRTLGKIIGNGIMPVYPFFILSIISIQETYQKPLDKEITSQGYCYQAFIYIFLRKSGVKNDDIDTYINFLTELSFFMFNKKAKVISKDDFESFIEEYKRKFNLPVKQDILLKRLFETNLITNDSFNNYFFSSKYIYYFFVAKYLAEHQYNNTKVIVNIINNLQKDENAYIAIFISHHTKNNEILNEILLNAKCLFEQYRPATLDKKELEFFDEKADNIVQAVLHYNKTAEEIRIKQLETQDEREEERIKQTEEIRDKKGINNELGKELRRSVKTVEVMGSIIKNRAGSLEKEKLAQIFEEGMKVHLRILSSFLGIINKPENEKEIVNFIKTRLEKFIKKKSEKIGKNKPNIDNEKLKQVSKEIFWNMSFFTVYSIIYKIIHSIGSDKLIPIVKTVCENEKSPVSFILEKGILMWYHKNLNVDDIVKRMKEKDFSRIAENILKFQIVNYCSMHKIKYKDKQKIKSKLRISMKSLIRYDKKS